MKFQTKTRLAMTVAAAIASTQLQAAASLEEIVVTAQKTEQSLQDVPITVNVVTGEVFDQNAAFELEDLNKMAPGLVMNGNKSNPNIAMRGVSTVTSGATTPRTNIFIDNGYMPNQQLAFFAQFDVERFELLRGPQGTLYGKSSPTASIVVHTKDPDMSVMEGYVKQSFGQYDLSNTQFGVSVPLIEDELAVRIAGLYDENNTSDGEYTTADVDQLERNKSGRITFLWTPGDLFTGRLSHTYTEWDSNIPLYFAEVEPGTNPILGLPPEGSDLFERKNFDDQLNLRKVRINQTIAELNFNLDWATLTSQTYYAESTNDEIIDKDATPFPGDVQTLSINFGKLFNQELRLTSSDNDFWDWIVGVYYADTAALTNVNSLGFTATAPSGVLLGIPVPAPTNLYSLTDVALHSTGEDLGIFTHNTFFLSDAWTLTAGLRWNWEERGALNTVDTDLLYESNLGAGFVPVATVPRPSLVRDDTTKWIDWTGTVKIAYKLSEDAMVYVTYDRGGRTGGQTLDLAGTTPGPLVNYDPETSDSVEIGYKGDMLDGTLRVNAAAYYQIYNDFQYFTEGQPLDTDNNGSYDNTFRVLQNAKEVVSKGAEVELTYLATDNLSGVLSVSYNDTKFEDFDDAICSTGMRTVLPVSPTNSVAFLTCDFGGQRVGSDAGNLGVAFMGSYSLPLESLNIEWYLDVLYNYNSERISPVTRFKSDAYDTVDLFTGVRSMDGNWDLKLWVKNVADEEATRNRNFFEESIFRGAIPAGTYQNDLIIDPRQVGVTATYNF